MPKWRSLSDLTGGKPGVLSTAFRLRISQTPDAEIVNLFDRFYHNLPVRSVGADEHLHLLNEAEAAHIRRSRWLIMLLAALLSVAGFLAYYLPVYWFASLFPANDLALFGASFRLPWGELLWAVLLAIVEIVLLTLLNIAGVHEIAVATGFLHAGNKPEKTQDLLRIGLEKKTTDVTRYGIDPFQGLNKGIILLFNTMLRLKGWLGNQIIRYATRALLGRYAVRAMLDFAGMPLYMAINAYSVHTVMREAQVIIMGRTIIGLLVNQLPRTPLTGPEKELLYDTLQYIAVSKRDFHQNHYLLTRELLEWFHIATKQNHHLPDDYFTRIERSSEQIKSLCRMVILLGFILDGHISWRERRKLRDLNAAGILTENLAEVRNHLRNFLQGRGVDSMIQPYLKLSRQRDDGWNVRDTGRFGSGRSGN